MTTYTMIILVLFVMALSYQFVSSLDEDTWGMTFLFGFELLAFAYLAKTLM